MSSLLHGRPRYVIISKVYGENKFEKNKFSIKLKKHNALAFIKGNLIYRVYDMVVKGF